MRVLIVSQFYTPEPVPLPAEIARALRDRGHDVVVITGWPNYPEGRRYPGYRRGLRSTEIIDGVPVRRVPLYASHSRNAVGRMFNFMSFGLSVLSAGALLRRAQVVYVYGTPMTAAFAPAVWRCTLGVPFVLHVQDLWPESVTRSGMVSAGALTRFVEASLGPFLRFIYGSASTVAAIAPTMRRELVARGVPESRSVVVYNWATDLPSVGTRRRRRANGSPLKLAYAGNLGEMQDLETVLRAVAGMAKEEQAALTLLGDGVLRSHLEDLSLELGLEVRFEGRRRGAEFERLIAEQDFLLVPLRDEKIFDGTIPSKFQAALARGKPVITTVRGDVRKMVLENRLGFVAEPEDPDALRRAIVAATRTSAIDRERLAAACSEYYRRELSRDRSMDRIERSLTNAIDRNPRRIGRMWRRTEEER